MTPPVAAVNQNMSAHNPAADLSPKVSNIISGKTVWISDIHLGSRDCKADYLLEFLQELRCDTLYLVGDIVDLWAMKRRFRWPAKHQQIMMKFYELAAKGMKVIYVPGNHDEPMRRFAGDFFGPIEIIEECEYQSSHGKRFLIMHGDAMDAHIQLSWLTRLIGDHGYELLLFINRWSNRIRRLFGRPYFSLASLIKNNIKGAKAAINTYEIHALDEARRRGYDGVICGHIHHPELRNEKEFIYANCGDWVENCTALIEDYQGVMRLLHYTDQLKWKEQQISPQLNAA
jgi:UDP-2,3-diacylglucosamine pyrophosphatase LpxH